MLYCTQDNVFIVQYRHYVPVRPRTYCAAVPRTLGVWLRAKNVKLPTSGAWFSLLDCGFRKCRDSGQDNEGRGGHEAS